MEEQSLFHEAVDLLPPQKPNGEVLFPIVLTPNPKTTKPIELTEAIKANRPWLDSLLHQSGAILFRGFSVSSASDFNDVVESSGYEDFSYGVGGAGSRTKVVGRVYTANEAPPHQNIPFHHEMSHSPVFPSKLFFFCEVEPGKGGETCIALSHVIYERMEQKHPKFVKEMEEKGFIYTRVLGDESDHSSPVGRSWKEVFMTDDKTIAEERAAKLGMKLEWMEGAVKAIIGPNPGFRYDEVKKHKIWFNGVVGRFEDKLNNDPANAVVFSDGKPLPADVSDDCAKIFDEECVALQWRKGDVLLLDNLAVVHSRRPLITLPRRVLASFCK
ncbi:putative TauD/TfdA-like domain, taurine dioxygenase TauD-like superfamily [Helianthus annuus]|nr:putative TauD/TfdA-like domain, taurine dioxygenase TauD-like superfamily [Helianthus annuus]